MSVPSAEPRSDQTGSCRSTAVGDVIFWHMDAGIWNTHTVAALTERNIINEGERPPPVRGTYFEHGHLMSVFVPGCLDVPRQSARFGRRTLAV